MSDTTTPPEQPALESADTPAEQPAPDPADTPAEPAKRSRKSTPAEPVDPHAGFAVYDETLTRYVSSVFRGDKAESDAGAELKRLKGAGHKGHTLKVRPV